MFGGQYFFLSFDKKGLGSWEKYYELLRKNTAIMAGPNDQQPQDIPLKDRDLHSIFRLWEEQHSTPHYDPVPILTR